MHALTGWSQIDDSSVWDCALAIDSALPIKIVQYNPSAPQQSSPLTIQSILTAPPHSQSRLIVDASTHARVWQLWSLLCGANPAANSDIGVNRSDYATTWLSHSASQVSADVLSAQPINKVVTYNNEPLEVALSLNSAPSED